ncbi:protein phosphatase 2C domain-containing protein [Nocardia sp. NPDC051030]|uniref:protein phosphatase 2C domain-containing protein n=1 Tax=Nocardia sp. NPDC051030 TaxID=3155162 RepID=UPI003439F5A0
MDGLLSIGDFSARCGLSAKMLRSYAAAGLLVPAAVDRVSGYRYYSTSQLHQARVVALLRRAGIAVSDIAEFYDHPDPVQLDHWEREVARDSMTRRQALVQARAALALGEVPPPASAESSRKGSEMRTNFLAGVATQKGGRDTNQDAVLVGDGLFAVADGLGRRGDVASRLALDTLGVAFAADRSISGLLNACREANQAVWQQASAEGEDAPMGTTLAAVAITSDVGVVVVHVGDSRLYRFQQGRLDQLTLDHTFVGDLIRSGKLSEEDAQTHPHRQILTRALGVGPVADIDFAGVSCEPGDRLVLCTDGLFRALPADDLEAGLATENGPQQSADQLVATAVARGAEDNVTAMILAA